MQLDTLLLVLFVVWGIPLGVFRSRFRKRVYQTDSWVINVQPVFWKEIKALVGNEFPGDRDYQKLRNFYRWYLGVYTVLLVAYLWS